MAKKKLDLENVPRLTREQAAVIGVYTRFLCGSMEDVHNLVEELLGRPVFTHELPGVAAEVQKRAKSLFLSICCED